MARSRFSRGVGLGFLLVAISCGGSGESGGSGSGNFAADYPAYCKNSAARDTKCGDTPDEAACLAKQSCFEAHWRTSALSSALACDAARECNQSDDACYANAGAQVSSPSLDAYKAACNSWLQQCSGTDDLCAPGVGLIGDTMLANLAACMKKPCAEASQCMAPLMNQLDCFG